MNDAGPGTRAVARAADLAALGHRGDLTADEILTLHLAASDPDARVRAAALGALVRAAPIDEATATWQSSLLDHTAVAVRRRACELAPALASRGRPRAISGLLLTMLDDRDVTVVEAAAWALGELTDDAVAAGAVAPLAELAGSHRDPLAREAAVAALGALGDEAGLPAILGACTDKPAVRRRAVLALAPFEGADVDAAIEAALTDRDWQVRQAAEDLLGVDASEDEPNGDEPNEAADADG